MAINLEAAFSTVVHTVPPRARLEAAFASIVHTVPPRARLEAAFASIVHTVPPRARLEASFATVVSTGHPATAAIVSNTPGTGPVSTPFTFVGSSSIADTWAWSFTSVPAGSAIPVGNIPFPDGGATSPVDMTDNEVLYHANEASGTTGTDSSGNGNDATLNTITVGVPGHIGTAWNFTAAGSRAVPGTAVTVGADWTVAFWYYSISTSGWATALFGTNYHAIVQSGTDRLGVYIGGFIDSGATITRGEAVWRHMAVVGTGGDTLFYLDGVLAGTCVGRQVTNPISIIGNSAYGERFADRMDELAVWSRALSPTEIANIYALQTGTYATTEDLTFTPDVEGTYTVQLAVTGYDLGVAATDSTTATFTTGVAGGGGEFPSGGSLVRKRDLVGRFAFQFVPKVEE